MPPNTRDPNAASLTDEISRIPQKERVELAILLVRDIDQPGCAMSLHRLSAVAMATYKDIRRAEFERGCG